jgi:hypothetical protein
MERRARRKRRSPRYSLLGLEDLFLITAPSTFGTRPFTLKTIGKTRLLRLAN